MSTYIVGDIQGCYSGLRNLLNALAFDPANDTLYAVGDLIARGEDSLSTVQLLRDLGTSFKCVLGNHDLHMLAVSQGIKKVKDKDKLKPLLNSPALPDIIDWYRQWPLAMRIDEHHTMAHAGLYPGWSVAQILALSDEVSDQLKSNNWQSLLKNMYGDGPKKWQDKLTGIERQRFIINATTRMRFISKGSELDLKTKCAPGAAPSGLKPWFDVNNPQLPSSHTIVFGHWAALMGKTDSTQFLALDTGYVWGNTLTAWCKETKQTISVKA
ncbi:symmetrical bis(5'-nucleosyl)-tetraphosphatase [Alteromonas gilva]|uniref:bis(5'-nucleosyl)-tetraphosphatase (symmetrical) n=1 Tax=Alteromonas gilva TaxID=2987522 RepID=A0ABT5KZ18_9ALTE|nr:symmetrical bis(5'-nucleosyl)-tetraphosphatase [Alteromonas gilva]MDC8830028.1 symmetrical bis(5'-nucleosyl)-tetraphosphatase [Alteromonas gilva]